MARILSQVDTIRRGSVGGITYTANQWHQIIARARTSPVNPGTVNQTIIRSAMAQASSIWLLITDQQRSLWNEYAGTCIYSGPMGQYTIPGRQMFMAALVLPIYCEARGLAVLVVDGIPPEIGGFYTPGNIKVGVFGGALETGIAVDIQNDSGEDGVAYVQRSFAYPVSRGRFKGPYLSEQSIGVPIPTGVSTQAVFDGLVEGLIYFTHIRCFTAVAPFRISAEYFLRHTAVDTTP